MFIRYFFLSVCSVIYHYDPVKNGRDISGNSKLRPVAIISLAGLAFLQFCCKLMKMVQNIITEVHKCF